MSARKAAGDGPYPLPEGWRWVKLGEVADVVSGGTPRKGVNEFWDGDVQWATPADLAKLDGATISNTPRKITEEGLRGSSAVLLPAGSVLLSSRAPIGYVAINEVPMATNQGFKNIVPGPEVEARYLYHWLLSSRQVLQSKGNGATFKELSKKTVESLVFPLAPLPEQRRIADVLDKAHSVKLDNCNELNLLDTILIESFDKWFPPGVNSRDNVQLGDVVDLRGGKSIVSEDQTVETLYKVLKISAVTSGYFNPAEFKWLPGDYVPPVDHLVEVGDLLMSRANTTELVGATAYVGVVGPNVALPDKVWKFVWKIPGQNPIFWHSLLSAPSLRRKISKLSSGSGGSMKNISKSKLLSMTVPFIDSEQQNEFADYMSRVRVRRELVTERILLLEELIRSLNYRAFRGEL
ncbi:MAG: restriction endonuclease subunit S [Corynebacterium variabile]|uniref:restriction endonuclease subunit S n=1 Tax=Corynebacterium variabile TaxID=1727 RepID=UPI003F92ABB0